MSSVSYSIFLLRCFGLWYCDDWLTGWKAKVYMSYTIFIFSTVYSFTISHFVMLHTFVNDANEFADASFVLLTCLATCGKMINMISKRKIIGALLKVPHTDPFNPKDNEEFTIDNENIRKTRLYTCLAGILAELSCTMLTVVSFIRYMPHKELPHKSWLPFSIATTTAYGIAFLHQILARYIVANINIGFDCLVPGMMMITCTQLKIVKHRIEKIHQTVVNAEELHGDKFNDKDRLHMEEELITNCIEHHSGIIQYAKVTNKTFATSMFLQYCASTLILCVSTYNVTQVMALNIEFFCLSIYLAIMLIEIYILCRYATEVTLESQSVMDAIYSSNWQSLSVNTQKSMVVIMTRVLHPIKYRTGHITLSLDSFTDLLKLSYSVYNVLQQRS